MKFMQFSICRSPVLLFCVLLQCLLPLFAFPQNSPQEILQNRRFAALGNKNSPWNLRTGGLGRFSVLQTESALESGPILSAKVRQISEKPWSMELLQRLTAPILRDSVLKISFDYKITPGYIFHFYWQVETSPWPKLLSLRINEPVNEWKHLSVTIPVHEGHPADTTALSFHLAETLGELQLKNISVLLMPPGTDPGTIPSTMAPVLGGDFYDKDWRNSILEKISRNRISPLKISVLNQGKPAPNAEVICRQLKNDLLIGAEASAALLMPEILNRNCLRTLRRQVQKDRKYLPLYRKTVLNKEKFDFISVYDAFIWKEFNLWGKEIGRRILSDIRKAGLLCSLPALYIPAYMYCPTECRNMDAETLWQSLFSHLSSIAEQYGPLTGSFGVLHGAVKYSELYHFIGVDSLPEAFRKVHAKAPQTHCYLSSPDALGALSEAPLNDLLELISWLKNENVKLDGIILQADFQNLNVAPQSMEKRLEKFAAKAGLPIHIRNFAVNEEKDDVHSDMIRDFLLLFYAEPRVASLSFGEQWSPALLNPRLGYRNADFSPRPAMAIIENLICREWRSSPAGHTDADGTCSFRLHHGQYSIQVKYRGRQITQNIHTSQIREGRLQISLPQGNLP